ncbi:MAG: metallophosphatase family protein [Planctomycetes bacterium]|nr:metallophosphatase family protein [Planctomycetota bacterium]
MALPAKIAVLSDIHSNIEAFEACIGDVASNGVEDYFCLGDIIGYGPNPRECLDIARDFFRVCLIGNHEEAVLDIPEDFNEHAKKAVHWTRDTINSPDKSPEEIGEFWNYIDTMRKTYEDGDYLFVHGSPRDPTREYIMPRDGQDKPKMADIFAMLKRYCFVGHTHVPGVFRQDGTFIHPAEMDGSKWKLNGEKALFNIGSVGQPRDQDNRSCYLIIHVDDGYVEWRRVKYDYVSTMRKIRKQSGLSDFLADRLAYGK